MKKSILLIAAMIFFMAGEMFGSSIVTQRVVNACGFVKGSTTLSLSGKLNDAAMQSISSGNAMAVYNYLDDYLTFPTLLSATKAGYGKKTETGNVSVNAKNGKFKWTEKDVTACFAFATGGERIRPDKAVLKSQGSVDISKLTEIENKKLTVFDKLCADQSLGDLASLVFTLQQKGKNYKFSYNENDIQAKVSVNSKGKVTAKYTLSPEAAYPAILESECIFTNQYDYSLVTVGEGGVSSAFSGPDQVEFRVTENLDKFRYFSYKGTKVTNDFMTLELEEDTEVQAVFGTYDLSVTISGKGSVSYEFVGPDEVMVTAISGEDIFNYFEWDENSSNENPLKLTLTKDTELLVAFKADKEKYMVVDLATGAISYLEDAPEGGWTDEYKTTQMVLRKVKAGTFTMGSPEDELGRYLNEVQHEVTLTKDFYIAVFQTTQKQYETITGSNPSYFSGDTRPVERVSYNMIRGTEKGAGWPANGDVDEDSFLGKLRAKTSKAFDLPTEAQWEYACRAATTTALNSGKNLSSTGSCPEMNEVGRYSYNGGENSGTAVVGSYLPNAWGLYDMHGNVNEWCLDWWDDSENWSSDPVTDPVGSTEGTYRLRRGGSYGDYAYACRSAFRSCGDPSYSSSYSGFRVVLVP